MLNTTPAQSAIDLILNAVAALAPRKIRTSADPDTKDLLDMAGDISDEEIKKANLRAFFRNNKLAIKAGITKAQLGELWRVNYASTMAEKNAVIEAELRQRGLTAHGEPAPSQLKVLSPVPAVAPAAPPMTLAEPVVSSAMVDDESLEPLVITASRFGRLTAQERSDFGLCGGLMRASEFEKLSPAVRMSFMKSGGRLQDDPPKPKPPHQSQEQLEFEAKSRRERAARTAFRGDGATMRRTDFEKLTATEQMQFFKNNGQLTD